MLKAKDTDKTHRMLKALWQMQKLDIKRLKAAFDGKEESNEPEEGKSFFWLTIALATRFPHDVDINLVYRKHCLHCFSRFIKRALNSVLNQKRIYATANKIKGFFDKSYWRERLRKTAGNFRNLAVRHTLGVPYYLSSWKGNK
jgi:hypothetical protein